MAGQAVPDELTVAQRFQDWVLMCVPVPGRRLKAALGHLASHPQVDAGRIGAIGFCLGGSIVLTWACTDNRLAAVAPFYGPRPGRGRRSGACAPAVGSWPGKDFTTKAASRHLLALRDAGLLSTARHGHQVRYSRTELGSALLRARRE
jgi:hypothetical protein